jgi:ribose-phosphate pyrophosphokinase
VPLTNLTARPLFTDYFRKKVTDETVVVAPDAGAIKTSTSFAGELGIPVVYMDKKRDLATGKVTVSGISRSVAGADVIIIDDMIVTGDTLIETAKYLRHEQARSVTVCATHHLYVPGAQQRLEESEIDKVVVTDTIAPAEKTPKLEVLSVADIIARDLMR